MDLGKKGENEFQMDIERIVRHSLLLSAFIQLSQRQFSEKVGIFSQSMVSIETGKHPLPRSIYLALFSQLIYFANLKNLLENFDKYDEVIIHKITEGVESCI